LNFIAGLSAHILKSSAKNLAKSSSLTYAAATVFVSLSGVFLSSCGLTGSDPKREPGSNGKPAQSTIENNSCAKYDAEKRASIPACSSTGVANAEPVVTTNLKENQEVQAMGNYALINLKTKPPAEGWVGEVYAVAEGSAPITSQFAKIEYNAAIFCLFLPPTLVTGKYTVSFIARGSAKGTTGIQTFNAGGQYATVTINYNSAYGSDKATLKSECPDTKESSIIEATGSPQPTSLR
jgi:hypothetical protein